MPDCEVVAVCDRELLMAKQLAERFGVAESYSDRGGNAWFGEARCCPYYYASAEPLLGWQTMPEAGHSCLPGKAFHDHSARGRVAVELADRRNLKLAAGHNLQFTPEMIEMRRLVENGFLGGHRFTWRVIGPTISGRYHYVAPTLGNRNHWVRQLPGQLVSQSHQPRNRKAGGISR